MGKRKMKSNKRRNRPINDINHNSTNITVNFKAIIEPTWTADTGTGGGGFQSIPLNPGIAQLAKDLAVVYKLYRFTKVHLQFQADPLNGTTALFKPVYIAMNYIPALETAISSWPTPNNLELFEGPAVGFYAAFRGSPYNYTVPSKVLNAMPYNWYETKQNTPEVSDFTQGQLFLKTTDKDYYAPILATFTVEFQTLEDPEFLASLQNVSQPRIKRPVLCNQSNQNRQRPTRSEEEYDKVSIYAGSHTL